MTINSKIKVNSLEAYDPPGPVLISYGATVPSGSTFTVNGGMSISGVVTATSFSGSGANLTNIPVATRGKAIALTIITEKTMSKLKVNRIVNYNEDGPPELTQGATVAVGSVFTVNAGVNVSGVVTATSFSGSGANLTNIPVATQGKSFVYKLLIGDAIPFRA